jgi:hypothetical protein
MKIMKVVQFETIKDAIKRWDRTRIVTLEDAESFMNYFGEIYDIHNRLLGLAPKELIQYYEKPIVDSGYSMGEEIKVFYQGNLISEDDFRKKYNGKYRGSENHGLIVINFPTKKKLREYLEKCKELSLHQKDDKLRKWSSEDAEKNSLICQELRKIVRDCIVYEESKIKKGYE